MITPNINRSVPVIGVIKYTNSKKQNEIMKKLKRNQERNKKVDLDNLPLYDCIQEQEDDWVSSVLGSNTDAFRDLF